jgi:glycogen(starch) synthase
MKLLMTTDPIGGVWTYTLDLVRALRTHDVETAVASMGGTLSNEQRREARAAGVAELFATDLALEWMRDRWSEVEAAGEWLLDVRAAVEPELVHLNGYVHAALPWGAPVVVVAHSCVYSWYVAVRRQLPGRDWTRYRDAVEKGLRAAHVVVAPSRAMLRALDAHYRYSCERVVIHNGRTPRASRAKEPFVLAGGRSWDEAKNVAAVSRVAERLQWPTRIVGAGSPTGVVSRATLDDLLARAAIYCAPARYEPFGLGALEAAQAGCALVLGDIPSLREVWGDGAAFVDPDDDEALAARLSRLIDRPAERHALAEASRARASRYTPERMASAYMDLYTRVGTRALEEVA